MRGVTLESRIMNADRIFGATRAVQELIKETFGKPSVRDERLATESKIWSGRKDENSPKGR